MRARWLAGLVRQTWQILVNKGSVLLGFHFVDHATFPQRNTRPACGSGDHMGVDRCGQKEEDQSERLFESG